MNTHASWNMLLAEQAADWVVRRLEDRTPECNAEFIRWLKDSPHHIDEFLLAATTYAALRDSGLGQGISIEALVPQEVSNVVELKQGALTFTSAPLPPRAGERRANARIALAAAIALFAGGGWMLWSYLTHTYSTGIGEQRMVQLEDGSLLHLNTRSRVRMNFSGETRQLRLLKGEAFFAVAKDPARPFQVLTDNARVQVIGTGFNVHEQGGETRVAVLEGAVSITPGGGGTPVRLGAGEQAAIRNDGQVIRHTTPDLDTVLSWRERQLIFRAVPLAVVAEQFNRYNTYQIRIEGEKLQGKLIWGVFPVDEPQALVKFLAQDQSVKLEKHRNGLTATARK